MSQKNHWPRDRCAMTGVERLLPCEQRQAFGTAQRRSHAAKLEALQRKALEVSQGVQGVDLCEAHLGTLAAFPGGPHMAHPNIYTSTFHTSSILIHPHHHPHPYPISSSVLRPPSSFIRHPSSFNHASVFHHSSCLHPNQERQEASKCKAWTPRGRWDIKSSQCWPLKCCNPAKDSCTSLPEDSFLASQSSHGITLRSKIYRYTVRCLGSPGQKCKDNNMNNVAFAVAKSELLHVALYRKNVLLRGLFFFVRAVTSPFMW